MRIYGFRVRWNGFPNKEQHGVVCGYDEADAKSRVQSQSDQILWVHVWETPLYSDGTNLLPVVISERIN